VEKVHLCLLAKIAYIFAVPKKIRSPDEVRAISKVFQAASLLDHGVLLELQLPLTSKRLDCLVTGYDAIDIRKSRSRSSHDDTDGKLIQLALTCRIKASSHSKVIPTKSK
jgi:hypothetical protein